MFYFTVAPEIISHTLKDISMFDSLPLAYEVKAKGVPKPEGNIFDSKKKD